MTNKISKSLTGNQNAKKPDEDKKIKKFWVMCTEKEKGLYVKASRDEGMTLAAWIRGLCNKEIERKGPE